MVLTRILILALILISTSTFAFGSGMRYCVVDTDCPFHYVPTQVSDGYSRDATLTITSTDDIDIWWYYDDDTAYTEITEGNQTETCPPSAGEVCMDHVGNGAYLITIDASLVNEAGKTLCLDVQDVQGTRTVGDVALCKDVLPVDVADKVNRIRP